MGTPRSQLRGAGEGTAVVRILQAFGLHLHMRWLQALQPLLLTPLTMHLGSPCPPPPPVGAPPR